MFHPEDGVIKSLRKFDKILPDYTAPHPRREDSLRKRRLMKYHAVCE
jgi:hypothetical protein